MEGVNWNWWITFQKLKFTGGHSSVQVVWVCPAFKTPLFIPVQPLFRSPAGAWFSSLDPTLIKNNRLLFWEICPKFEEFSVHSPQNVKNFQLDLCFANKVLYTSILVLCTGHPYPNQSWVPPPSPLYFAWKHILICCHPAGLCTGGRLFM